VTQRQQLLHLYMSNSAITSPVIAWAFHDGAAGAGPVLPDNSSEPPYAVGVQALEDGWRLIQMSPLNDPVEGTERRSSYLRYEFLFERMVDIGE
jgi:hypothetical protein